MTYLTKIETKVAGIPCIVGVTSFVSVRGNVSADNEMDYHGYTECEFEVCDRRGRPAPWLARKMTTGDVSRIESEIAEYTKH